MERLLEIIRDDEVIEVRSGLPLGVKMMRSLAIEAGKRVYGSSLWLWCLATENRAVLIDFSQYPLVVYGLVVVSCVRDIVKKTESSFSKEQLNCIEEGCKTALRVFKLVTPADPSVVSPDKVRQLAKTLSYLGSLYCKSPDSVFFDKVNHMLNILKRSHFIDEEGNLKTGIDRLIGFLVWEKEPSFRICPVCLSPHPAKGNQYYCDNCKRLRYTIKERVKEMEKKTKNRKQLSSYREIVELCSRTYNIRQANEVIKYVEKLKSSCEEIFRKPRKYTLPAVKPKRKKTRV